VSRVAGQQFIIGQRCWFEIGQYVRERYPSAYQTIDEHDTQAIIDAIDDPRISAIILEPLGNHPDMTVIDLSVVAAKLTDTQFERPKILVLDTVHIPELDIFARYFSGGLPRNLCIALVISGVKFLQAGWDISKSGLVTLYYNEGEMSPLGQSIYEKLIDIRSVAGRAPSIEEAYLADMETATSFRSRLRRYDRNTKFFAESLDDCLRRNELGHVTSPWVPRNERHALAMAGYGTGGRILFVNFNPRYFDEAALGEMFKLLAHRAEQKSVSLMAAPSFGLAAPHIHVVIRPGMATTLRISTGSTSVENVERLLELVCDFLLEYKNNQH
jgi:cystathionine beta-lyase/cystathionine gamma-synthase